MSPEDADAWERFESAVDAVMKGGAQHRKAPEWVSRATIEVRPVGPSDAGIPEDTVMPVVVPLHLPAGKIFHDDRTGARFDSDGRLSAAESQSMVAGHD